MAGGAKVRVHDGKASVGRKFLVAGRGGLNLTHAEARERFISRYSGGKDAGGSWFEDVGSTPTDSIFTLGRMTNGICK